MKEDKMKRFVFIEFLALLIIPLTYTLTLADTVVLKDGQVLQGTLISATDTAIRLEVEGTIQEITISDITSLTFSPRPAPTAQKSTDATAVAAAKVPSTGDFTIPAESKVMVKLTSTISTKTHKAGSHFTAVLETALAANGVIVVPAGTKVYGMVVESVGGRRIGNQKIVIQFTQLSINDQLVPIATDPVGAEGGRGGAAKTVGAGALVGAAFGGGSGAAKGAAVGAGLSLLAGGNHIQIPEGTIAEVSLKQPLTIHK
jgi:hypothetical protein